MKTCDFRLNGGFLKRKLAVFCVNWGICKEKMRDFRINGGFEKTRDFRVEWGILEEKTRDFRLNEGFLKRKRVIFAQMQDS